MKRFKFVIVGVVLVAVLSPTLFAQSFRIIPFAGFSKDMRSATSNRWSMGFTLGAQSSHSRHVAEELGFVNAPDLPIRPIK